MSERHCLVVEDSPIIRQLLGVALARVDGLCVTEAQNGLDGMRKLSLANYNIVLTDINMPIMDGLKLVRRVRSDPKHQNTPIIVITTDSTVQDRDRALRLGANAYITKPVQAWRIIEVVNGLLQLNCQS